VIQRMDERKAGVRHREISRRGIGAILPRRSKITAADPCVQLRARSVDRAQSVVDVPMNGHGLAFFPALNGGHVAVEVGRNLLPRIQAVF
jgi:hypothetical protein